MVKVPTSIEQDGCKWKHMKTFVDVEEAIEYKNHVRKYRHRRAIIRKYYDKGSSAKRFYAVFEGPKSRYLIDVGEAPSTIKVNEKTYTRDATEKSRGLARTAAKEFRSRDKLAIVKGPYKGV